MFRFDFTPQQKEALTHMFAHLSRAGYITGMQATDVLRYLLDLPPLTGEERREEEWADRLAPTAEEHAAMKARAAARHAKQEASHAEV